MGQVLRRQRHSPSPQTLSQSSALSGWPTHWTERGRKKKRRSFEATATGEGAEQRAAVPLSRRSEESSVGNGADGSLLQSHSVRAAQVSGPLLFEEPTDIPVLSKEGRAEPGGSEREWGSSSSWEVS